MSLKYNIRFLLMVVLVFIIPAQFGFSSITREGDRTYITDLTGEKWEITQAVSLGFKPEGFQHGIGKHAFDPLDESDFDDVTFDISPGRRVIGVANDKEAQAVSVSRLAHHEIANTTLGDVPIAIAY